MSWLDKLKKGLITAGNTLLEGITAGYYKGKDNYTGAFKETHDKIQEFKNLYGNPIDNLTNPNYWEVGKDIMENKVEEFGNELKEDVSETSTKFDPLNLTPTLYPNMTENTNANVTEGTTGNVGESITMTNNSNSIFNEDIKNWMESQQQKQWNREDAIRKETQLREDSQYSRAIEDLRNSGVNINLLGNIPSAGAGGGITQATGLDYDVLEANLNKYLEEFAIEMENNFKGDENTKDRTMDLMTSIMQMIALISVAKK